MGFSIENEKNHIWLALPIMRCRFDLKQLGSIAIVVRQLIFLKIPFYMDEGKTLMWSITS